MVKRALGWVVGVIVGLGLVAAVVGGIVWSRLHPSPPEVQVWWNGEVLTMDPSGRVATALAIENDRIVAVGTEQDVAPWREKANVLLNLEGRTVVPGFIEAHGHFPGAGLAAVAADLNSPPIGSVVTIAQALDALRQTSSDQPGDHWLIGFGYDDTALAERRHLNRADLDSVSTERPVIAMHISGHMVVCNSVALAHYGIDAQTPDPPGGEIEKDASTGEPTGLLLETAGRPVMLDALKMPPLQQVSLVRSASNAYGAQGFTTVQNGLAPIEQIKGLSRASKLGLIDQRVVIWPSDELGLAVAAGELDLGQYASKRVTIGATKFVGDGSIQGYTGYLRQPYFNPATHAADYRGYPNIDAETLRENVKTVHCAGQQVAVHGNGDAAIDQFLDAWEEALAACAADDARPILVHAQMATADQLERMARLGVSPSFFSAHVYYWGDRHRDVFVGPERAARISPAQSAKAAGLRFTTHLDAPVVPIDSRLQLWAPVARLTSTGAALGPEERISAEDSLRTLTSDAAWQLFVDDSVGSIETGKLADLVILSSNPLAPNADLRAVEVDQTVLGGVTIFERSKMGE